MELSDVTVKPISKKKRKSRKGLEKVYKCSEPDCNKRFTRMEHLARHQLNHNPKQIYECSWPGCDKSFVREDLQKRHFKRHEQHEFTQDDIPSIVPKYKDQRQHKSEHLQDHQKHEQQQQTPPAHELEVIHSEQLTPLAGDRDESYMAKIGNEDESEAAPPPLDPVASASEIISWIFSDAMLANVKEPLLSPSYYTFDSPMALQNLLTPPAAHEEPQIGLNKRQQLLELMPNLLPELSQLGYTEDSIFQQRFITTYWTTFHPQFPILHKPTFNADQCPGALLWCIIMIGAAVQKEVVIARSIAEPLRWIIFGSADFNPPAKLWIIQALLILEVYEKTMSDRQMHERAIIHHGTTLQLIRRGTILTGEDSGYLAGDSGDPWKRWIQSEATKRAALMAFVVDAYHNCMFGHHSLISIHEIRLSLPCSQYLWDYSSGTHPMTPQTATLPLIEALKLTLNNKHVDTSPFGRKAILSGLLSIRLQMLQRDFQIESLDWHNSHHGSSTASTSSSSTSNWKEHLHASFDFWINDHRKMLKQSNAVAFDHAIMAKDPMLPYNFLSIGGCADPFYHLAHLTLEVSVMDLQIVAGAPIMYSRSFRGTDYERSYRNLQAWANTPSSINQVRTALLFLEEMYLYRDNPNGTRCCPNPFMARQILPGQYQASEDKLVHRPHAIFLCTLVIWCYGFVLNGPESDIWTTMNDTVLPDISNRTVEEEAIAALERANTMMQLGPKRTGLEFIAWFSKTIDQPTPRNKMSMLEGRNETSGLLKLVIDSLRGTDWALIDEDVRLLTHCLERTLGKPQQKCSYHI